MAMRPLAPASVQRLLGRLKQSGMFWSVAGANAMLALCGAIRSNRFDDFWEGRAVQAQAA